MDRLSILALSLFIPLLALASPAPKLIAFAKVSKGVYRGGRPRNQSEMDLLAKRGIKTVINLQGDGYKIFPGESEDSRKQGAEWAAKAHLRYINSPFYTIRSVSESDEATIQNVARMMNDPQLQPVYVHCNVGADRTGMVVAAYRILYQGCSYDQARKELLQNGKLWTALFTAQQMSYLKELQVRQSKLTGSLKMKCPLARLE